MHDKMGRLSAINGARQVRYRNTQKNMVRRLKVTVNLFGITDFNNRVYSKAIGKKPTVQRPRVGKRKMAALAFSNFLALILECVGIAFRVCRWVSGPF
jgi:hypothetical protein